MNFIYGVKDNVEYEQINRNVLDVNVVNMPLIIIEENYYSVDDYGYTCRGYYMIIFLLVSI